MVRLLAAVTVGFVGVDVGTSVAAGATDGLAFPGGARDDFADWHQDVLE
jgi:hypothetical protein